MQTQTKTQDKMTPLLPFYIEKNKVENKIFNEIVFSSIKRKKQSNMLFENCKINRLTLKNLDGIKSIEFVNCEIGTLDILFKIERIDITTSSISHIFTCANLKIFRACKSTISTVSFKSVCSEDPKSWLSLNIIGTTIGLLFIKNKSVNFDVSESEIDVLRIENSSVSFFVDKENKITNSKFVNCSLHCLKDIDLGTLLVVPLCSILTHQWKNLSPELTALCMAYDAQNHPDPDTFDKWSKGGACPYSVHNVPRSVYFYEKREFYNHNLLSIPINPYRLLDLIFAEKNIKCTWG